jgi:hypothetical protein
VADDVKAKRRRSSRSEGRFGRADTEAEPKTQRDIRLASMTFRQRQL